MNRKLIIFVTSLLLLAFSFARCQDDIDEQIDISKEKVVTSKSSSGVSQYNMITATQVDWSGTYLLTCISKMKVFNSIVNTYGYHADLSSVDYNTTTKSILSNATTDSYAITIDKLSSGDYSIKILDGKYLYYGSGNSLSAIADPTGKRYEWSLTLDGENVTIENITSAGRKLRYNASAPRFACYISSPQTVVQLFKKDGNESGGNTNDRSPAATVVTTNASNTSLTSVTLSGSYSNATSTPTEVGFYYGTSSSALNEKVTTTINTPFSKVINGLNSTSTYYYKSYVKVFGTGEYATQSAEVFGAVKNFTLTSSIDAQIAYGGCLEMPAVSCETSSTFTETFGGATGHKHTVTGNQNQVVITHVIEDGNTLKRNYTMLFDKTKKAPLWSACVVHQGYFDKVVTRTDTWRTDPALTTSEQQSGATYGSGGYSRGHIVASADRLSSTHCNNQTFYHTNIAPQWQNSFNSGVWSTLEGKTQGDWNPAANSSDTLYMVTGILYKEDKGVTTNGSVKIPSHFYKVLVKCKFSGASVNSAQGIAFYYENRAHSGASYNDATYVKSIDWIETQAGFDFFANLPAGVEQTAEANTNLTTFTNF